MNNGEDLLSLTTDEFITTVDKIPKHCFMIRFLFLFNSVFFLLSLCSDNWSQQEWCGGSKKQDRGDC